MASLAFGLSSIILGFRFRFIRERYMGLGSKSELLYDSFPFRIAYGDLNSNLLHSAFFRRQDLALKHDLLHLLYK